MHELDTATLKLSVQDQDASLEELQGITRKIASTLETGANAEVSFADVPVTEHSDAVISKGAQSGSILDIQINLGTLKAFGGWFYDKLLGTPTEVSFECEGIKFVFKGRNAQDRAIAIAEFERFLAAVREKNKNDE